MKKLKNVPVTNRGQWDYPGMDTIVPSGQITMKGVPYPVMGMDNTGHSMMMMPGGEYSFPGDMVYETPMLKQGGYVVTRSNDRKGKTHKVTGPDGTVKYFGDSKLGQHPKDPERKAAFYARHKKNLDNNPYFRAFARKTWEEGGEIDEDIEMMMQNGGGWLDKFQTGGTKHIPTPDNRVYNDNTQLASARHTASTPTPKANITSLIKDKEYQLPDRSPKTEAPAAVKQVLGSLDKATDYMQMAHFIPDPTGTSQVIGTLGDVIGVPVDLAQSAVNVYEGDYGDAAGNLALAGLTGYTGMKGNGYTRPVSLKTGKGASGTFLNKKLDSYRPMTPANSTLANNPVIQRGLGYNKATLAGNVAELANSAGLPDLPPGGAQTLKEYKDNTRIASPIRTPFQMGGDAKSTIDPAVLNSKDRTIVPDVLYPTKVFYEDYMNSPRYLEMLEGKKDAEYIDKNRFKNLVKSSDNLHSLPDEMWNKNVPQDVMGFSVAGTGDIFVEPEFAEDYSEKLKDYQRKLSDMSDEELANLKENETQRLTNMRDAQDEIMTHEMSHTTDRPVSNGFRLIPEEDELEIRMRTAGSKKEFDDAKNIGAWEYLTEPTEVRARLNAIRKDLFDKGFDIGNKKVNMGDLKDLKTEGLKDLKKVTTDADIIWMLNNISSNTSEPEENYAKYGGQHGGLDRWFAEKWVDVKTGKACGRQEGEKRKGYPACRPSKRVSADTPKTASELSASEKAKFKREKTSSQRINYNHKKEEGGEIGWLDKYK